MAAAQALGGRLGNREDCGGGYGWARDLADGLAGEVPFVLARDGDAGREDGLLEAQALLAWRRVQLRRGGSSADFDWLLEFAGGLGWSQLQRLRLDPGQPVALRCSLGAIAALWSQHLETATPLQYLVGIAPWRDFELAVGPGVLIPRQETELLIELVQALGLAAQAGSAPCSGPISAPVLAAWPWPWPSCCPPALGWPWMPAQRPWPRPAPTWSARASPAG